MEARLGSAMGEYVFEPPDPLPDYWSFSEVELARSCLLVAESRSGPRNGFLRAEAMRLFCCGARRQMRGVKRALKRKTALPWGLRKRTIQILVRLSMQGLLFIP